MDIMYKSTRSNAPKVTASEAILTGLAPDGGLYVPDMIPPLPVSPKEMTGKTYQEIAFLIMREFLSDFTDEEIRACIDGAYDEKFDTPEIAPLAKVDGAYYLELYHGKTIAFKDMALSILPYLMTTSARKNHQLEKIVILTATSGDTGKAALAGFEDVPGTEIIVFYPAGGVSTIQELQMLTTKGRNTHVVSVEGNFDDCQTGVKKMYTDPVLAEDLTRSSLRFSSANSINVGRLVPQIVYYVYSYVKLLEAGEIEEGEKINITVPTGNFGNILAAYYAGRMGLPVARFICASNENKVLFDFFKTGVYDRNREFILTSSPSMDILISSNLERLIYEIAGEDSERNRNLMTQLTEQGVYGITPAMKEKLSMFVPGYASEDQVLSMIHDTFENTGYVLDPHTAVAGYVYKDYVKETGDMTKTVIASTASPYKFTPNVMKGIDSRYEGKDVFELIDALKEVSGMPEPPAITEIRDAKIMHDRRCAAGEMRDQVKEILGLR